MMLPINNRALVPMTVSYSLSRLMAGQPVSQELLETAVDGIPMVTRDGFFREILRASPAPEEKRPTANLLWRPDVLASQLVSLSQSASGTIGNDPPAGSFHPFDYCVPKADSDPGVDRVLKKVSEENRTEGRIYPATLCSLGDAYLRARRYDEALLYYRRALRIEPHPRSYTGLAVLYRQIDQLEDALEAIDQADRMNRGKHPRDHYERGLILRKMGRDEEALQEFSRAITLEKGRFANSYLHRGITLRRLGRLDEAMDSIRAALALDPHCPFALNEKQLIEAQKSQRDRSASRAQK